MPPPLWSDRRVPVGVSRRHRTDHLGAATQGRHVGSKDTRILIAGAGIGGLTAAGCLLLAGYDVEIYEQAPELGE
ncbi:MAG: NAD(P)-binding protein, partial [Bauldia litoralis]